jgi:hypothetical protein
LILAQISLNAQTEQSLGLLPQVTLSRSITEQWSVAFQLESMQRTHQALEDGLSSDYLYIRTDITPIISYRMNTGVSLATGYMHRFVNGKDVHRTLQQYAWVQRKEGYRMAHRLRSDQTFRKGDSPIFRMRYRLSFDVPLEGMSQNIGEFYLVPAIEQLLILQSDMLDGETRLLLRLGRNLSASTKLEIGMDHRFDGYIVEEERHRTWMTAGLFFKI